MGFLILVYDIIQLQVWTVERISLRFWTKIWVINKVLHLVRIWEKFYLKIFYRIKCHLVLFLETRSAADSNCNLAEINLLVLIGVIQIQGRGDWVAVGGLQYVWDFTQSEAKLVQLFIWVLNNKKINYKHFFKGTIS